MDFDWDWDDVWLGLVFMVACCGVVLVMSFAFHKKDVNYYYVETGGNQPVTCAKAHWIWNADAVAYCSDDYLKVLDFVQKANMVAVAK